VCFALLAAATTFLLSSPADALSASVAPPDPKIGAVFRVGSPSHYCTAGVVDSPRRNLLVTAAHCVIGDGSVMRFVPAFNAGQRPYGTWTVLRVYLAQAWIRHQDWQHDYAFLEVAPTTWQGASHNIEDVVGANRLAAAPSNGQRVTVTGYVAGSGDQPITCRAGAYFSSSYPAFDCHGYFSGVSGSPWVNNGYVHGVIGGYHLGGCSEGTSYSSAFGSNSAWVWHRATTETHPDVAPAAASDGC